MLEDFQPSELVFIPEKVIHYSSRKNVGSGYSFPCDYESHERIPHPSSDESYAYCVSEAAKENGEMIYDGIVNYSRYYREPAYGTCVCGVEVVLYADYGHGIACPGCNRIYNMSGQELAPRSQWEDRYDEDSTQPYNVEFGYTREDY